VFITPAVVGDLLYIGSCSGVFYAFDRATGDVRWSYDTMLDGPRCSFHGDLLAADGLIVVGSDSAEMGYLYAFEAETGIVRWKKHMGRGVSTDILRYEDHVLSVTMDGELFAVDLASGEMKWSIPPDVTPLDFRAASAVLMDFTAFFVGPDARVYAVDAASGKILWRRDVGARPSTSLARIGSSLYLGTEDERLIRLDTYTGRLRGMVQTEGRPFGMPVTTANSLFLLTSPGLLTRFDASLEKVLWSQVAPTEWSSFRPLPYGDGILAGDEGGELFSFALDDGALQWSDVFQGAVRGLGSADDVIYVGTLKGMTYAYRPGLVEDVAPPSGVASRKQPAVNTLPECEPLPPGATSVLGKGGMVVFGEFHGTREGPRTFGALACAAVHTASVVLVGLEFPVQEEDILQAAFTAPSPAEAEFMLLESGFFSRDYQDGRSSRAMVDLILRLRSLHEQGAQLDVFSFDPGTPEDRDRLMATRIAAVREENPEATFLLLSGNLHARKSKGSPWDPEFTSMTHHLTQSGHSLRSVRFTHAGGASWYCNSGSSESCGIQPTGGTDQGPDPLFVFLPSDASDHYDAVLYLGRVSPSEPATGTRIGHATP